jgi:hypothetical protein
VPRGRVQGAAARQGRRRQRCLPLGGRRAAAAGSLAWGAAPLGGPWGALGVWEAFLGA